MALGSLEKVMAQRRETEVPISVLSDDRKRDQKMKRSECVRADVPHECTMTFENTYRHPAY